MADYLALIQKIIDEHKKFKEHIRLIGDTISDREALSGLEKARTALMPSQLENLAQKQEKLQQLLSVLDEGLRNHFAFEERTLPPLLGEVFMKALALDHRGVGKKLDEAKAVVFKVKLEGLSRQELEHKQKVEFLYTEVAFPQTDGG